MRHWLIGLWLACFLFCMVVPLYLRTFIPNQFKNMLLEVVDTFGPGLGVMLAFFFGKQGTSVAANAERRTALLAVAISIIYCGLFTFIMAQFAFQKIAAVDLIDTYKTIRPLVAFLVTGMIAYYFGSSKARSR